MKTSVIFKNSVIAVAIGLVMASCGGRGGNQQSGAATTETKTEQAKGSSAAKPKVEGIFGAFGLTDADVTPKGATVTLDGVYTKLNDSHIQATALFDNWNDAAGYAAYPGYIADVMKAIAKADDYGRPSVKTKDGTPTLRSKTYDEMVSEGLFPTEADIDKERTVRASWECHYTYGGKRVRFTVDVLGAQYQIIAYFTK
jgi:hypothetical protein